MCKLYTSDKLCRVLSKKTSFNGALLISVCQVKEKHLLLPDHLVRMLREEVAIVKRYKWIRRQKAGSRERCDSWRKAMTETNALRWLNKNGCQHVPQLLEVCKDWDPDTQVAKHRLFMTKLPGVTLKDEYGKLSWAERDRAREAFVKALR